MNPIVRTRFAPSPTGYLHIGSVRTALFCWLYARHHSGVFILRIEDTDLERSTPESVQTIIDGMKWMGLDWDEGPFYQTQRFDRYREVAQQFLDQGKAYRCVCTKERLEKMREHQMANKEKPRYDGHCRDLNLQDSEKNFVVRFRNPIEGAVSFKDEVCGEITVQNIELDDLIIARSDGVPTYNFTVVVDDWDMGITQVIRGTDHINNTPRQINMFYALGATPPLYAHIPMILGSDGKKLSKRHGAVSVLQYEEEGYLPEAMMNYLVRLGWSHGDQEIFSREEMVQLFNVSSISKSAAAVNPEKLLWLNQHYLKTADVTRLAELLMPHFKSLGIDPSRGPDLKSVIALQVDRCKTLKEMAEKSRYFYEEINGYEPDLLSKHLSSDILPALNEVIQRFTALSDWQKESIHQVIFDVAEYFELKLGKLAQPIRVVVTGGTVSPPVDATLALVGQAETLKRFKVALGV